MKVGVLCEFSGTVRDAFIAQGHEAISFDLLPTDSPGPHIQGDVRNQNFESFDLLICHPTCTYLCNSGVHCLYKTVLYPTRWAQMEESAEFFRWMLDLPCDRICVENPVMHKHAMRIVIQKYTQTIQSYQFGEPESKRTCLWLKGLPPLIPTNILSRPACGKWNNQTSSGQSKLGPSANRWKIRSKTYQGIANAMALQWGSLND